MVLTPTWPFPLTAWRWAQRCRAAGAAVHSLDGRVSSRLLARSAPPGWRLVVGPHTPLGWVDGVPAVVAVTADDDDLPSPELAAAADEVWASSSGAAERLQREDVSPAPVLVPFLGAPPALPPSPPRLRPAAPWRLVCTARPTWRSGVGDLLLAVAELNRTGDPTRLRLVDDGTDATVAVRFTVAELGLDDVVEFGPLRSFAELAAGLRWAHAFVLPAVDDGAWPETAEARRAGLAMVVAHQPTLTARLAGWPPAELVPPRRPQALAAALRNRLGGARGPAGCEHESCDDVTPGLVAG